MAALLELLIALVVAWAMVDWRVALQKPPKAPYCPKMQTMQELYPDRAAEFDPPPKV